MIAIASTAKPSTAAHDALDGVATLAMTAWLQAGMAMVAPIDAGRSAHQNFGPATAGRVFFGVSANSLAMAVLRVS